MRRVASAVLFCAGLFPSAAAFAAENGHKSGWHEDFESAKAEAERLKLPLLLHFHASWCGPCQAMESSVLNTPDVLAACGTKCVAVKVDFDAHSDLAAKYGVAALPTDVFLGVEGKVLGRNVGPAGKSTYLARIDAAAPKAPVSTSSELPKEDVGRLLTQLASAGGIGLDGYSPVSLAAGKVWREGSPEFVWRHDGVIYFMADAGELEKFKAEPEKYAPKFSGFDPLILSTEQVAIPGHIAYGSFYEGRLHLHATEESRAAFIRDPARYPAPRQIEVPTTIATGPQAKPPVEAVHVSMSMGS